MHCIHIQGHTCFVPGMTAPLDSIISGVTLCRNCFTSHINTVLAGSVYAYTTTHIIQYDCTVLYSSDHKGVGVANEKTSPKSQPHFSLMIMR